MILNEMGGSSLFTKSRNKKKTDEYEHSELPTDNTVQVSNIHSQENRAELCAPGLPAPAQGGNTTVLTACI